MNGRIACAAAFSLVLPLLAQAGDRAGLSESPPVSNLTDTPQFQGPLRIASFGGSPFGMPSNADLLRRGARIGRVLVQVEEVFEESSRLTTPYRLVNGLHVSTQEDTVLQQLLFRSGDLYDPRVIAESERLLRSQRYFNDAVIQPVDYQENEVDVLVRVHDVWTLSPGVSFGRKGGENSARVEFEDTNFLGLGKQLSLGRSSNVDRTAWRLGYGDPNVLGSRWAMSAAYSSLSDGTDSRLALQHPFYSLDTRWSAGLSAFDTTSAVSRYSLGELVERVNMDERQFELKGGLSTGLRDGWVNRVLGGVRYLSRSFTQRPDEPDAALPADRVLAYPWIGFEAIEDDYVSTRNLDQIGRTEDLYLGKTARFELGFAPSAFGATRNALVLGGSLQTGSELGEEQFWINALEMSGRVEDGNLANSRLGLSSRYYLRHSMRRVSFASITAELTSSLDAEEQLLLGGDNGLRGFPLRYQSGTSSALVTVEERFYTNWQPLKLVNVGAAVFVDAGRTWGRNEFAAEPSGWLANAGIGLRLGNARSGLGNVLHVDVAFPLNGPQDVDSIQFVIETRKSF